MYAVSWNGSGWHLVGTTTTGGHIGAFDAVRLRGRGATASRSAGTTQFVATTRSESAFWNGTRWKVVLTA